jgi:hypothetical protein
MPALFRCGVGVTVGVGVGAAPLDAADDDPGGVCVAVVVLGGGEVGGEVRAEVGIGPGRTATCAGMSSAVSDPAAADFSDATKADVVAMAGAFVSR